MHQLVGAQRFRDLEFLANLPSILAQIAPGQPQAPAALLLSPPGTVCLGDRDGMALFYRHEKAPGGYVYSGHYLMPPWTRGPDAKKRCVEFLSDMFTNRNAVTIYGAVPRALRAARVMTRALGFIPVDQTTDICGRDCVVYRMERRAWAAFSGGLGLQ